jgi:flagellar biogenesis protein FliO
MKESTLESLDKAIAELKTSIKDVSDTEVRKELEKTLKNLIKAREKMNPAKPFTSFYLVAVPFVLIFALTGIYYFVRMMKKESR